MYNVEIIKENKGDIMRLSLLFKFERHLSSHIGKPALPVLSATPFSDSISA
jgi:hypothetical protein